MRLLFYSHDGMGLGHVRRHLAISAAVSEMLPTAKVLLATSVDEVAGLGLPPNVDTLKLPALRKVANNRYECRRLGLPAAEFHAMRSALLLQTVRSFRPAVVLADKHPFGPGDEFKLALEAAKSLGAKAVLGLRDILDDRATVLKEWSGDAFQERIAKYYDMVLVYGQQSLFDPVAEYHFSPALTRRTQYCGYVVHPPAGSWYAEDYYGLPGRGADALPVVLGTAGGGEDGFDLLRTFILAAKGAHWRGIVAAGPMLSAAEFKRLRGLAEASGVRLHPFIRGLSDLFRTASGLVCMGGYNTLVEAVSNGVPTVCVPRDTPRCEQLLRARVFERLGLVRCLVPNRLTVESLRSEVAAALATPRSQLRHLGKAISLGGARCAAGHLGGLRASVQRFRDGRLQPVLT